MATPSSRCSDEPGSARSTPPARSLLGVQDGAIADGTPALTGGGAVTLELSDDLLELGWAQGARQHDLSPAGIAAGEGLAAAGVDHSNRRGRAAVILHRGEGECVQARNADELGRQRLGKAAGGRDPDAQAGEASGADADGDPLQVIPTEPGLCEQLGSHCEQAGGMPRVRVVGGVVARVERRAVGQSQPDGGGLRGGIETEHDHRSSTSIRRQSSPR